MYPTYFQGVPGASFLKGPFGITLGAAAKAEFREHQWDGDQAAAGYVNQDKSSSAIFARYVRETPYIAQSDD